MFEKIVVAVDGSDLSDKALETAIQLVKGNKADELHLIHVVPILSVPSYGGIMEIGLQSAMKKESENIIKSVVARVDQEGIPFTTNILTGEPGYEIVDYATKHHANLIVMGTRGHGRFKEWMLGSVSHKVSQLTKCPVLLVV